MNKMLGTVAAAAMLAALALPAPAAAAEPDAGIHKQVTHFSSQRVYVRHRHYVRPYYARRYYGGYYRGYYGYPYYGYSDPYYYSYGYPYYRRYPYSGPGFGFRFGPFGFGVW